MMPTQRLKPALRHVASCALVATCVLSALPGLAMASPETEARNRQIVTEAFERWQAGGTTFFQDVLSPDVVWTIEGSGPSAGRYEGREALVERAVRPLVARLAGPIRPVEKTVWADGDHVIVRWEGVATARDGQPYVNRYAWILRMQDGRAVEVTAFLDLPAYDEVLRRVPAAVAP
ncbi:nuclear transport factor 2 family protein [Ancylobacter sp. IITR112]|uniref:nuclear transport factor 2 family protein n=1 Tax=Ancylobacter sp. IITR112 TaxID=3138073 RepID=UPI003529FC1F